MLHKLKKKKQIKIFIKQKENCYKENERPNGTAVVDTKYQ